MWRIRWLVKMDTEPLDATFTQVVDIRFWQGKVEAEGSTGATALEPNRKVVRMETIKVAILSRPPIACPLFVGVVREQAVDVLLSVHLILVESVERETHSHARDHRVEDLRAVFLVTAQLAGERKVPAEWH